MVFPFPSEPPVDRPKTAGHHLLQQFPSFCGTLDGLADCPNPGTLVNIKPADKWMFNSSTPQIWYHRFNWF